MSRLALRLDPDTHIFIYIERDTKVEKLPLPVSTMTVRNRLEDAAMPHCGNTQGKDKSRKSELGLQN
jgi:hypothetical protein